MEIIKDISQMQKTANTLKKEGKSIGFVPTMGFLHAGHLSLIEAARRECQTLVVSIFVNPLQFGAHDDFNTYPRDLTHDSQLAGKSGVDILFIPDAEHIYPGGYQTQVAVPGLSENLCGRFRIGHFQGVTTVVCKLFHIVKPDIAYFGQKDYQQLIVINKMVADLNMEVQIKGLPIVRQKDGLAMSSRNAYLNERERKAAHCLYNSLCRAKQMKEEGITQCSKIISAIRDIISAEPMARPEYIRICHPETLQDIEYIEDRALLAMAVHIGKTRLIDNCFL